MLSAVSHTIIRNCRRSKTLVIPLSRARAPNKTRKAHTRNPLRYSSAKGRHMGIYMYMTHSVDLGSVETSIRARAYLDTADQPSLLLKPFPSQQQQQQQPLGGRHNQ